MLGLGLGLGFGIRKGHNLALMAPCREYDEIFEMTTRDSIAVLSCGFGCLVGGHGRLCRPLHSHPFSHLCFLKLQW